MVSIRIQPCELRQAASPLGPVPCPWGLGVRGGEDSLMCLPSSTLQDYFFGIRSRFQHICCWLCRRGAGSFLLRSGPCVHLQRTVGSFRRGRDGESRRVFLLTYAFVFLRRTLKLDLISAKKDCFLILGMDLSEPCFSYQIKDLC